MWYTPLKHINWQTLMASPSDIALVKLAFKLRDDFSFTDDEIGSLLDSGMGVLGTMVFICDAYLAQYTTESESIKVGPIAIDSTEAYRAWDTLKKDLIIRFNNGIGVPGVNPMMARIGIAGASTGPCVPDQFWVGQFDNPPASRS